LINKNKFPLPINKNVLLDLNMISLAVIKIRLKLNRYLMFPMNHKRYFSTDMSKKTLPEMTEIHDLQLFSQTQKQHQYQRQN
jgi:hypothetical protein